MRKIIISTLAVALVFSLTACSRQAEEETLNDSLVNTQEELEIIEEDYSNISETEGEKVRENNINQSSNMTSNILAPQEQPNLLNEYSQAVLKTNLGDIQVKLYAAESPITVNNFLYLAQQGFYNNTKFHRVIKDFMIQGGDPLSKDDANLSYWGTGGPEYRFADEFNHHPLVEGSLAMANAGPNTNGSQFFIVTAPSTPWLDGAHTNFGEVVSGLEVVKAIGTSETDVSDRPVEPIVISSIELLK
jgi:cyclophilin family peptidyl-prolyl cis-trans isomerase